MTFKSLAKPRERLADQVYEQIMMAIRKGHIAGDDRLVQEKLAEDLEISRTPVREALLRMEQEGILCVAERGGYRIREFDANEIRELYDARCAIEGYAVRLLAQSRPLNGLASLRRIITEAEDLREFTIEACFEANKTVHRALVEAAGNRLLLGYFDNLWNRGSSFTLFASLSKLGVSRSLGDHLALLDSITRGDASQAAAAMIAHIQDGYRLQLLASEA